MAVQTDLVPGPSGIVCYADPADDLPTLVSALVGFEVTEAKNERAIRTAVRSADVLVLSVCGEPSEARRAVIARLRRAFPTVAFVLVTERDPRAARCMVGLSFEALVWREGAPADFTAGLAQARAASAFERMARAVESSNLPTGLRRALALALRRTLQAPIRTLQNLADAVHCRLWTLRQEFHAHAPEGYTLGDFLSALQVLRVVHLKHTGLSWHQAASRKPLRFTRRTLRRKASAWPGCRLKDLEVLDPRGLLTRFVDERLLPLVGRTDS